MFAALKIVKDVAVGTGKAIIGYAQDALDAYAELEQHVATSSNVFGKNFEENRDAIESFSRDLAKKMPYSASETADALYYLGLTGLDLEHSMGVVDQMLKLAYVDGGNVQETVDLITDAMSGLRMEINRENTTAFMDELTTVMSATNTNAQQALEAILGVGSTAQMLGMNNNELGATLGVLANYGKKGSEAGTAVNSMLTRMVGNSTAIGAYKDLGVSLYDQEGKFRGLSTVLSETADALDRLTDEDRNPIMKDLFGIHYMNEGNILLGAMQEKIDKTGQATSEYLDVLKKVGDAEGTLEGMYQNQTDTLDAQKKIASQQWNDLKLSLGEALEPAYLEVLKWINQTFFPAAEDSMDVITGIIQENLPNIPIWLNKAKDIIQPVLDGLPGAIQKAYEWGKSLIGTLSDYFQGEEWQELVTQGISFGGTLKDAFLSIDWPKVAQVAGNLGSAAANLVDGVLKLANSETVKFLLNTLGGIISAAAWVVEKITGGINSFAEGVNDFAGWMTSWDFSQYFGENKEVVDDFSDRANEAQVEVDNLNGQIKYYQELISEEKDPKVIDRLSAQVDTLNDRLKEAKDRLTALTDAAEGIGGSYYSTNSLGGTPGFGGNKGANLKQNPSGRYYQTNGYSAAPFADGGIVTRPTLSLIGEAGEKEAVIPLSKIGDVVRNVSGGSVNYAPVINVTGGGDAEGVKAALSQSYQEFKANYSRMVKENRRLAFTS